MGTIGGLSKVGTPVNGKQLYEARDERHSKKIIYIVPQEHVDKFEKLEAEFDNAIEDTFTNAGNVLQKQGSDVIKRSRNVAVTSAIIGAIIPATIAIFSRGSKIKRSVFGVLSSLAGAALGAFGSTYLCLKSSIKSSLKADNINMQKIDEISKQIDSLGVEYKVEDIQA